MHSPHEDEVTRAASATGRPFIICTLQRTGGTNLTNRLKTLSNPAMAEHEPFNLPRVYGHITRHWQATRDPAALKAAVREVCARRENIKHCVEMVPWKVTQTLLAASTETGFRHLFLYRRDMVGRIQSIEYAQRTKVWGPRHIEKAAHDGAAFAAPLDVPRLIAHETRCIDLLNRAWRRLRKSGAKPAVLAYEDLYGPDEALARRMLAQVLDHLGLSRGAEAEGALLRELRSRGDQNTRDRYGRFHSIEVLRAQALALPELSFSRRSVGWGE